MYINSFRAGCITYRPERWSPSMLQTVRFKIPKYMPEAGTSRELVNESHDEVLSASLQYLSGLRVIQKFY